MPHPSENPPRQPFARAAQEAATPAANEVLALSPDQRAQQEVLLASLMEVPARGLPASLRVAASDAGSPAAGRLKVDAYLEKRLKAA